MENADRDGDLRVAGASPAVLEVARGRLADRGIDPHQLLGRSEFGGEMTTAGLYVVLGSVAATEKAGQNPTHTLARLALRAGLSHEVADTLFLAYNQQSAEEAGHGDKVFGNAYYAMGGRAFEAEQSVVGTPDSSAILNCDDSKENRKRLGGAAALLGGIETVALQRAFPNLVALCEAWGHPIARDLIAQIRDVVRPEESRHVLIWRYVFHELIAPKGEKVIEFYRQATNNGRALVAAEEIDRETFDRMIGTSAPTSRQLLGKDRVVLS
jgi:hypothetical protein